MARILRKVFTANFLASMLIYAGYVVGCFLRGVDVEARLGNPHHSHAGRGSLWATLAFFQVLQLATFLKQRKAGRVITLSDRGISIFFGVFFLWLSDPLWLSLHQPQPLIFYVGLSDLAYGLVGIDA